MTDVLADRVAIVTGGTGALGTVVVERFLKAGAIVHATTRGEESQRGLLTVHTLGLTDENAVDGLFDSVIAADGRVDVLANLAGGFAMGPMAEARLADLDRMLSVNLRTCFACCRKGSQVMGAGGRIVNVGARAAVRPTPQRACYIAAKSAVLGLTGALARELATKGVTVNAVLPNIIDTPANRAAMPDADTRTWTAPEAIADVLVFLASPASAAVTGAQIPV